MKLSDFKNKLDTVPSLNFELEDGRMVPAHFHITEVGQINKHFIDCGGTVRNENKINFQLWEANDLDHRLAPQKLMSIIELSEKIFDIKDLEIEVEYQTSTIGKYDLDFNGTNFILTNKKTDCLAKDNCGVPQEKLKVSMAELGSSKSCCSPGSDCC